MGRPAATTDDLLAEVLHLDDAALCDLLDTLAGSQRVEDLGWRVRERRLSPEPFEERNDEIERLHGRGLRPGQIANKLGMTRDAVKQVLRRRRKRNGYAKPTYPPLAVYASDGRKFRV